MKLALAFSVCLTLVALLPQRAGAAAACDEACSEAADCTTDASCPVCIGTCVPCDALGDSTSCTDASTGAATYCSWTAGACGSIASAPELPGWGRYLIFFLAQIGIHYFVMRERACL